MISPTRIRVAVAKQVTAGKRLTEDEDRRAQRLEDEAVNEVRLKLPQGVTTLGWAALESWYTVARQRIKVKKLNSQRLGLPSASRSKYHLGGSQLVPPAIIAENDEIAELDPYPDWLTANITLTSKEMLLHWAKEARTLQLIDACHCIPLRSVIMTVGDIVVDPETMRPKAGEQHIQL
ncbi:hypothetical protein FOZ63_012493, partial [Perkinsus olseni]